MNWRESIIPFVIIFLTVLLALIIAPHIQFH